ALRDHLLAHPFAGETLAGEPNSDGPVEIGLCAFPDVEVVGTGDVVDADVDAAARLDRGRDQGLASLLARDIGPAIDRRALVPRVDGFRGAPATPLVEIDDGYPGAFVGEEDGGLLPDVASRSGHDRDLVLQSHGPVPCGVRRIETTGPPRVNVTGGGL